MAREEIEKFAEDLRKVQLRQEVVPQAVKLARAAVLGDSDGVRLSESEGDSDGD